jgi:hypothetical protein
VSPRATAPTDFAEFAKRSLFIAALVGLGLLLWLLWPVLLLIFAAVLVAIALRSLAIPFARWTPLRMSAAVGVVMILLVLLLSGTGLMLGVQLSDQLGELWTRLLCEERGSLYCAEHNWQDIAATASRPKDHVRRIHGGQCGNGRNGHAWRAGQRAYRCLSRGISLR